MAVVATWAAYSYVFSHVAPYDDQGYLLMIVRSFASGDSLYTETFSQYGPAFSVVHQLLFAVLGLPYDLNSSGLVQVGYWAGTTTIAGIAAHVTTRRMSLGVVTSMVTFAVLNTLRHEPLHPIAIIAFLLALVWLAMALVSKWPRIAMTALGVLIGTLVLVKLNVGLFVVLGVTFGAVMTDARLRRTTWAVAVSSIASVALPFVLMRGDLLDDTNLRFAVVASLSALSLVAANLVYGTRESIPTRRWRWAIGACVATGSSIVFVTLLTGTELVALLEGLLVRPLQQVNVFTIPWPAHPAAAWFAVVAAAVALGTAGAGLCERWRPRGLPLSLLKGTAALVTVTSLLGRWSWPFVGMAPVAWVAAIDVPSGRISPLVRSAMPMVATLHVLHGYPVAGAQRGVAVYPLIVIVAICFSDAWSLLPDVGGGPRRTVLRATVVAACAAAIVYVGRAQLERWWGGNWDEYRAAPSLALPGTQRYHIAEERVETYQRLSRMLIDRCSTFYTLPGLGSLYVFTGMRPPSSYLATDWMDLLSDAEQASVVSALEDSKRPCIVRYPKGLKLWQEGEELPDTPLLRYIESMYELAEQVGPYEVLVRTEND